MHIGSGLKAMKSILPSGASIGEHKHSTSIDFNYILSGKCTAVCDGIAEELSEGDIHYCPLGGTHSITNTGSADLILITFVPELKSKI